MIKLNSLEFAGTGLSRPECVLCTRRGDIFVSHNGKGVLHIAGDGSQRIVGNISHVDGQPWIPNGIALLRDRTFLVASMGDSGGVWRLHEDGRLEPFLREVGGQVLRASNFVLIDAMNRTWISVSTRKWPLTAAFSPAVADGYIVLVDSRGPRIVADGLAFANEVRVDSAGEFLYVVETFGRRIKRFRIGIDGSLTASEVFTTFGVGTFPDGIAFDVEDHLWVTSIVSNRVLRVDRDGKPTVVLEESDPSHIERIEQQLAAGTLRREDIVQTPARRLRNISSIAFGGPDLRTAYLGSLNGDSLAVFQCPIAGLPLVHWDYA